MSKRPSRCQQANEPSAADGYNHTPIHLMSAAEGAAWIADKLPFLDPDGVFAQLWRELPVGQAQQIQSELQLITKPILIDLNGNK